MESVELYACRNPETGWYKTIHGGGIFGQPLGTYTKLYKHKKWAVLYGREFSEVVKVKVEVIE